ACDVGGVGGPDANSPAAGDLAGGANILADVYRDLLGHSKMTSALRGAFSLRPFCLRGVLWANDGATPFQEMFRRADSCRDDDDDVAAMGFAARPGGRAAF